MVITLKTLLLVIFLLYCLPSQASDSKPNTIEKLALDPQWLKLLHYQEKLIGFGQTSLIKTPNFFFAKDGDVNPLSELKATLNAIRQPVDSNVNLHARCRFPARYEWLSKKLSGFKRDDLPLSICTDYSNWITIDDVASISVFFANGFFENPASFFGHSFIRLNVSNEKKSNNLLSTSLDYGAIIPESEHPLVYITKGIFGGYEASFSDGNYYRHNFNYGENQLRDLWEYELSLSKSQRQLLLHHLWEVMPHKFTYYFTYKNCGSAIAELIELAIPNLTLYDRGKPWVMPIELFNNIYEKDGDNKYISNIVFHPSRLTKFHLGYDALSIAEKRAFKGWAKHKKPNLAGLADQSKKRVLEVLLDYYQLLISKGFNEDAALAEKKTVMLERMRHSVGSESNKAAFSSRKPPHEAPPSSMLRVLTGEKNDRTSTRIQYRPVHFDVLGLEVSKPKNSELSVLDISLEVIDNNISLKEIDFLKIISIAESYTGLPGDRPISWSLQLSYGEHYPDCSNCNTFRARAGVGKAAKLSSKITGFGMFGLQAQSKLEDLNIITFTPSAGLIFEVNDRLKFFSEYTMEYNNDDTVPNIQIEGRYQLFKNLDIRAEFKKHRAHEFAAGISYYW